MKKLVTMSAAALTLMMAAHSAHAQNSGLCNSTASACTWLLDFDGHIRISGNGTMNNYGSSNMPWYSHRTSVKRFTMTGITSIGNYAFYQFSALTHVDIPKNVTSIGTYAFYGCTNLTKIIARNPTPVSISANVFTNVPRNIPLYVPSESVDAYRAAPVWKEFQITPIPAVNFDSQGGSTVATQTLASQDNPKASKPADPTRDDGYSFCGWYTNTSYTTEWNFNNVVVGHITLYAKWMPEKITVTYKCVGTGCNTAFGEKKVDVQRNP